jgi:hypothetical protein
MNVCLFILIETAFRSPVTRLMTHYQTSSSSGSLLNGREPALSLLAGPLTRLRGNQRRNRRLERIEAAHARVMLKTPFCPRGE